MKLVAKSLVLAALMGGAVNVAFAAGDAAAGQSKSAVCGACHGADGNSMNPEWPKLSGQHAGYIAKQLADFKSGARLNDPAKVMENIAAKLSDDEIAALGGYFASRTRE